MNKLEGKVAVVTGGNSGIGYETAKLFKAQGARVVIIGRRPDAVEKAAGELGVIGLVSDTTDIQSITEVYEQIKNKLGAIDILFLNAGIAQFAPIEYVEEELYDLIFNTNVKGLYFNVKKALPIMNEGGSIIFTTSAVSQKGFASTSVYAATKAAVRSFARTLTAELLPKKIRVNAIAPGPITTPIYGKLSLPKEAIDGIESDFASSNPMKRFGSSAEVAMPALFLASDDSSYISGIELAVDGGATQL